MDTENRSLRRSKRRSSVLSVEPTPRAPLTRTKKRENQAPVAAVNGSGDIENGTEDEESPRKKIRLETEGEGESDEDLEKAEYQEKDIRQGHFHEPKICKGALGDVNLFPRVSMGTRISRNAIDKYADTKKNDKVKPLSKGPVASDKSATQIRSPIHKHNVPTSKPTSMAEYQRTMEAKAKSSSLLTYNHHLPSGIPAPQKSYTKQRHVNNLPKQKVAVQHKKQGIKRTTAVTKRSSEYSSRGFMWYLWRLVLLLLLGSAVFLAYKGIIIRQSIAGGGEHPSRTVNPEMFADQLSLLESRFPSQRPELWKRSKIHLERHLRTAQPTEPVSLIFTAGLSAERTLHCLAQGLASSFSSALNASVLLIDGASMSSQDSDEVKLDIDSQLQAAFEGDKPVAVIHRFEELPPGSTLIFYRYCDHENAAYKKVFLLFTVLLPQDEVGAGVSLTDVEEMVQDYVKERLVGSSSPTAFNEMDNDKYGGLWSRIAHLILPVVSEKEVEQKEC
uniref:torsin-1A-interacting protein 2-like isoform X2 n=1 Tax=Semicossyphus pulcher TaxID=241346 RepID=UPI0037E75F77